MKIIIGLCFISTIFSLYLAVVASIERVQYQRAYESVKNNAEAFRRTIGRPINTNYICKLKK